MTLTKLRLFADYAKGRINFRSSNRRFLSDLCFEGESSTDKKELVTSFFVKT
jgi:hypothetical protein